MIMVVVVGRVPRFTLWVAVWVEGEVEEVVG